MSIVDNYKDVLIILFFKKKMIDLKNTVMPYLINSNDKLYHYTKNYYSNEFNRFLSGSYCLKFDIFNKNIHESCMQCHYSPLFIQDNYCKYCDINYTKDDYFQHHYCLDCDECKAVSCVKCENCNLCHESGEIYYYCNNCTKCFVSEHTHKCRDCDKCLTNISAELHNCCIICDKEYFENKVHCGDCNTCDINYHYYCKICSCCSYEPHMNCKTIEYSKCQLCDYKDCADYIDQDHYTCEDCNHCFTSCYCNKCDKCNNCYGGGYCTFCYILSLQNDFNHDCNMCKHFLIVDPRSTMQNRIDKYVKRIPRKTKKSKSYCFPYKQIKCKKSKNLI